MLLITRMFRELKAVDLAREQRDHAARSAVQYRAQAEHAKALADMYDAQTRRLDAELNREAA